jgi:hypothetical protein
MSQKREEGDLYITTIRDLLDYCVKIEKISFDYMPDSKINVNNGNDEPINGLSLVVEESYMTIRINKSNRFNHGMHTIHTINVMDDNIVIDCIKWTFSPIIQLQYFLKNRRKARQLKG